MEIEQYVDFVERGLEVTQPKGITDNLLSHIFYRIHAGISSLQWARLDMYMWCVQHDLNPWDYIDDRDVSQGTIDNGLVAWRIWPHHSVRMWSLSLSHYIVASHKELSPEERRDLLDYAEDNSLSRNAMRDELAMRLAEKRGEEVTPAPVLTRRAIHDHYIIVVGRLERLLSYIDTSELPRDVTEGLGDIIAEARAQLSVLKENDNENFNR